MAITGRQPAIPIISDIASGRVRDAAHARHIAGRQVSGASTGPPWSDVFQLRRLSHHICRQILWFNMTAAYCRAAQEVHSMG